MSSLFISDLHLKPAEPELLALAQRCLKEYAPQFNDLFILGDFVEYWLGDDAYDGSLDCVFNAIKDLSNTDTTVHLMYGNRDFLFGEKLAKELNVNLIIEDQFVLEQNGQRVLLMHGDTLCTDDIGYQQLRKMLRNPKWQEDFLKLSVADRISAAMKLRDESRSQTQEKTADIMDVNQQVVASVMQEYSANHLIHGHTHRPASHQFNNEKQTYNRYVLGDWTASKGAVIASMTGNKIRLHDLALNSLGIN